MSVLIRFMQMGAFHAGDFVTIDLDKVSRFHIDQQRNTCELIAFTPENPRQNIPYSIAQREREYELKDIMQDLERLRMGKKDVIYEITDTEVHILPSTGGLLVPPV